MISGVPEYNLGSRLLPQSPPQNHGFDPRAPRVCLRTKPLTPEFIEDWDWDFDYRSPRVHCGTDADSSPQLIHKIHHLTVGLTLSVSPAVSLWLFVVLFSPRQGQITSVTQQESQPKLHQSPQLNFLQTFLCENSHNTKQPKQNRKKLKGKTKYYYSDKVTQQ